MAAHPARGDRRRDARGGAAATCSPARARSCWRANAGRAARPGRRRRPAIRRRPAHPFGLWLALYALSGFVALSLEILWFRLVDVAVKSTAFTFGTVLAIYLLGSAAGCLLALGSVDRLRRPLAVFLLAQCAILLLSGAVRARARARCRPPRPATPGSSTTGRTYRFFRLGHVFDLVPASRSLYVALPLFLFALPTLLMGFAFPVLQRAVHDELRTSGRKVGVAAGREHRGLRRGQPARRPGRRCSGSGRRGRFGCWRWRASCSRRGHRGTRASASPSRRSRSSLLAAALPGREDAVAPAPRPDRGGAARDLRGGRDRRRRRSRPDDGVRCRLSVNGKGNSWLPFGGVHTVLGALPATGAPRAARRGRRRPRLGRHRVGRGLPARDAVGSPSSRSRRPSRASCGGYAAHRQRSRPAQLALRPPRAMRLEDGRRALEAGAARYDVIETDAIWPESAGSGNLYSVEFFSACARRLRPGGLDVHVGAHRARQGDLPHGVPARARSRGRR